MTPTFIYGTAWKKEATTELVQKAVRAGFRAIDTANQPKHYSEALVGDALTVLANEGVTRDQLFLQTKFTPLDGHDNRLPYDPRADLRTQVRQSFQSSLEHLKTDRIDSYLLHGPYSFPGLGDQDWEVWGAIEDLYRSGRVGMIGISNVNYLQLTLLVERAKVKPMMVQNRCYANRGWDREVREVCRNNGIHYQGFSLLTANVPLLRHPPIATIARKLGVETAQVIFRFAMQARMIPLTGTSDEQHMKQDLSVDRIELSDDEVNFIESVAG
jgi:diketogulonate reductase-like aldo/keto reductase